MTSPELSPAAPARVRSPAPRTDAPGGPAWPGPAGARAGRVHAVQTGWVRVRTAQLAGRDLRGRPTDAAPALVRQLAVLGDRTWSAWLPTFAWVVDHPEGVLVVDTGQGAHLLAHARAWHPYVRRAVDFRVDPAEELGPQLRALGVGPRDVRRVVLTHLHMDHDGGLAHVCGAAAPRAEVLVARGELALARGWAGRLRGYLPQRWPAAFDPRPLDLTDGPLGPGGAAAPAFAAHRRLTAAGDVVAVATPGHTAHHVAVLVWEGETALVLAGDAAYTEALLVADRVDGVSPDARAAAATRAGLRRFAAAHPTVLLPTHDPDSARRLAAGAVRPTGTGSARGPRPSRP